MIDLSPVFISGTVYLIPQSRLKVCYLVGGMPKCLLDFSSQTLLETTKLNRRDTPAGKPTLTLALSLRARGPILFGGHFERM